MSSPIGRLLALTVSRDSGCSAVVEETSGQLQFSSETVKTVGQVRDKQETRRRLRSFLVNYTLVFV